MSPWRTAHSRSRRGASSEPAAREERILLTAAAVDTFGSGLNYAILSIFLVRVVGLTGTTTGLLIGIAAGVALPAGYLVGQVVDSLGPRRPLVAAYLLQGVFATLLPFATNALWVGVTLSLLLFFTEGSRAARYSAIARIGQHGGVALRGRSTVVQNVAVAAGVGVAGLLIAVGEDELLRWGLWANAATFFIAATIQHRLTEIPPIHRNEDDPQNVRESPMRRRSPFSDRAYLAVVLVNAALMVQAPVFTLGYPLWVTTSGRVPLWMISVLFVLNTTIVVLFQMRVVHRVATYGDAARGWRLAGVLFLLACLLMAGVSLDQAPAVWVAVPIVLAAVVLHTVGELWHGSGQFSLALGLADQTQMGRYQGVFNLGEGVANSVAPLFVGFLCTAAGPWGWTILGVFLVLGGLAAPSTVRVAERTRQVEPSSV